MGIDRTGVAKMKSRSRARAMSSQLLKQGAQFVLAPMGFDEAFNEAPPFIVASRLVIGVRRGFKIGILSDVCPIRALASRR